jgi:hypothetical protein
MKLYGVRIESFKCMFKCIITNVYTMLRFLTLSSFFPAVQVLFKDGAFQWKRLENLIVLAKENVSKMSSNPALKKNSLWVLEPLPFFPVYVIRPRRFLIQWTFRQAVRNRQLESKLDLTETIKDGARMFLIDAGIRRQLILAFTEDSRLHVEEVLCPTFL